MFRRIFKWIRNTFRRKKKGEGKEKIYQVPEIPVVSQQNPEEILEDVQVQNYAAVPAIENSYNLLSQKPLDNKNEEPKECDLVSNEATPVSSHVLANEKLETTEVENEKEESKNEANEKISEKEHKETSSEEEATDESDESNDSSAERIQAYDRKITSERLGLQYDSSCSEAESEKEKTTKVENEKEKSEEEKVEIKETDSKEEKVEMKERNSKEENVEMKESNNEDKSRDENKSSDSSDDSSDDESDSSNSSSIIIKAFQIREIIAQSRFNNVQDSPQCPVGSAIAAKQETGLQQTSGTWIDNFNLKSVLGQGSFGKVFLAKHKDTKEKVAIKAVKKERITSRYHVNLIKTEKSVLQLAKREENPFLVGLLGSFQTQHHLCLAIDYCSGGDLETYINKGAFAEKKAVFYAGCVVLGLKFLHENNIIHRDLKPQNILIGNDGYAKITDFGLAKRTMLYGGTTCNPCGTSYYMAPEVVRHNCYTKSVDWWALGVIIYKMLLNKLPFDALTTGGLFEIITKQEPKYPKKLSADASSIIRRLLTKDQRIRLGTSARDADAVMDCSFFRKLDFDALSEKEIQPPFIPRERWYSKIFRRLPKHVLLSKGAYKPALKFVEEEFMDFDCSEFEL